MQPSGKQEMDSTLFLPGLPVELIEAAYATAPGNEIESGKFASPESSAALVANAFGLFFERPTILPPLPRAADCGWPAQSVTPEAIVRFPWSGGRHPCLDVLIVTKAAIIGVESKRYEPFRPKHAGDMSDAYCRPVWGDRMMGYQYCRDGIRGGGAAFSKLDESQLVKHAFALRTAVQPGSNWAGKRAVLYYLFAEPDEWPDGRPVLQEDRLKHRAEIAAFSQMVASDEVSFRSCSYSELLAECSAQRDPLVSAHASAVSGRFLI